MKKPTSCARASARFCNFAQCAAWLTGVLCLSVLLGCASCQTPQSMPAATGGALASGGAPSTGGALTGGTSACGGASTTGTANGVFFILQFLSDGTQLHEIGRTVGMPA